ncbi:hypothetical protein O3Q51_08325 [Cryomorphaceae bacterium 1068]|nr:hypothetical protein [Cryomorphaceae bacterium 1068]
MTETLDNKEQTNTARSNQSLEVRDKLYFGMVWWGVQSWSLVNGFKADGFSRKYKEARKAMRTGMTIYAIGAVVFILVLLQQG